MATAVPSAIPGYEAYLLEEARRRRMLPQAMQQITAPVAPPVTYDYSDLNSILPSAMSRQINPDFAASDIDAAAPEMPVMPAAAPVEAPQTRALPQAVEAAQSTLTQNVQPGDAVGGYRQKAADFSRQATEAMSQEPDMTAAQNYMRQRAQQGDMAMLNALAAQFAGERFEPIQAKYLKRAAAAREPMKVGRGMVTPDGQFIRDEGAAQDQRVQLLLQQAKAYEQMALTAETEQERRAARAAQQAIENRLAEAALEIRRLAAQNQAGGGNPYYQAVQTADGVYAFNTRTGGASPVVGANNAPLIGAVADPRLQGAIAGARAAGTSAAESQATARTAVSRSDQMLSQLTEAENILKAGPTQSGAGAAVDAAGRLIGASTQSAQLASRLETISGWLVANVPRMEGPQSNFDVQNYQTMAAKVGDRTVPIKERLAALDTLRKLQEKYKSLNQATAAGGQMPGPRDAAPSGPPPGVDKALWDAMTPEERALWK